MPLKFIYLFIYFFYYYSNNTIKNLLLIIKYVYLLDKIFLNMIHLSFIAVYSCNIKSYMLQQKTIKFFQIKC